MKPDTTILFVVNDVGFFISHRFPIALAARDHGYKVCVATPYGDGVDKIQSAGLCYHQIRLTRGGVNPLKELRTIFELVRLYREVKPDLIHHVTIKPVLYGSLAARFSNSAAIVNAIPGLGSLFSADGRLSFIARNAVLASYRWLFSRQRLLVIVQNRDDFEYLVQKRCLDLNQAELVRGSGVDLGRFSYTPENDDIPLIVLPARMLSDKGVNEFRNVAMRLQQVGLRARFALVGGLDPSNPNSIPANEITNWARSGDVEWWGARQRMEAVYRQASIVCLPSYREGLPKVLLEAAASGRAVVTTNVPGCREAVNDGENGFVIPPQDEDALVTALVILIFDRKRRQEMGLAGRKLAEEAFSIETVVEQHLRIYARALGA